MKNKLILVVLLITITVAGTVVWKQKKNSCEAGTYPPNTLAYKWIFEKTQGGSTHVLLKTDSQDVDCANKVTTDTLDLGTYKGSCQEIKTPWIKRDSDTSDKVNLDPKTRVQCLVGDVGKEIRVYARDAEDFYYIGDVNVSKDKSFSGKFKILEGTLVK